MSEPIKPVDASIALPGGSELDPPSHSAKTRRELAWAVVIGYLVLLAIVIAMPVVFLFAKNPPVDDVQKIIGALSGTLSGLAGILGFVVGYYFKAEESSHQPERSKKPGKGKPAV
jgi:hypothetical protein